MGENKIERLEKANLLNFILVSLISSDTLINIESCEKSLFSIFNLSNSEKIRKLYFKKMKLYEKKQVIVLKDYLTPEELKQMVESQTKDKIDEITNCLQNNTIIRIASAVKSRCYFLKKALKICSNLPINIVRQRKSIPKRRSSYAYRCL